MADLMRLHVVIVFEGLLNKDLDVEVFWNMGRTGVVTHVSLIRIFRTRWLANIYLNSLKHKGNTDSANMDLASLNLRAH